jgi:hypothetical protein
MIFSEPYGLNDRISFGKYEHDTIEEILDKDPDYIEWALDQIEGFSLDEEALEYAEEYGIFK